MSMAPWVIRPHPVPDARLRLFCFPFAGGSAMVFRTWWEALPEDIEVCAVQLPGREDRRAEKPFERMTALVRAMADAMLPATSKPYAFFGHSLGALVAFELARELRRRGAPEPIHLFASARIAPHLGYRESIHRKTDAELLVTMREFGGTPQAILQEPELVAMILPIVRADFALNEAEPFVPGPPLRCPITAYGGLDDERARPETLEAWKEHTTGLFTREMFPGRHFFLTSARNALLRSIARTLSPQNP